MDTIGIGAIGVGGMGRGLLFRLLEQDPRLKLTAVMDPDPKAVEQTLKRCDDGDVEVFENDHDLVKSPAVDFVMIASPNCAHKDQLIASVKAGKDVFCQKPIATTFEDALAMKDAITETGKKCTIGFTLRYSPHYRKIKELLSAGTIGDVISMEFNETLDFNHGGYIMSDWRRLTKNGGTHLLEKCCHDVDLVNWMLDSLPVRVASFGGLDFFKPENAGHIERIGPNKDDKPAFGTWRGRQEIDAFRSDKDIIDNQVAIIEYHNGVRSTFHTNCCAGITERRMYINGTEGSLRADVLQGTIETRRYGWDTELVDHSTKDGKGGHGGGDNVLARELADSILADADVFATFDAGLKAAVSCFAIDDAMAQGQVVDVRPYWEKAAIKL